MVWGIVISCNLIRTGSSLARFAYFTLPTATHSNTHCTLGTSWIIFLLSQAVACAGWRHRRVRHQPERPPECGSRAAREKQGVTLPPVRAEQCTVQHIRGASAKCAVYAFLGVNSARQCLLAASPVRASTDVVSTCTFLHVVLYEKSRPLLLLRWNANISSACESVCYQLIQMSSQSYQFWSQMEHVHMSS